MSFKEFMGNFNLEELKKIREMDWEKIVQKARRIAEQTYNCRTCNRKNPKYSCEIRKLKRDSTNCLVANLFCSLDCIKNYLVGKIYLEEKEVPVETLGERAVAFLALDYLEPEVLKKEGKIDFKKEIDRRIRDYDKLPAGNHHKKNQRFGQIMEVHKNVRRSS